MADGGETLSVFRSGIPPIDERLGGVVLGRPHLLSGTTGSGKTALSLAFVAGALVEGGAAAMLTQDEPRELLAQAADLGLDLDEGLDTGRFVLLRYQRHFAAHFGRALSTDPVFDELVQLMGSMTPDRFAIDSLTPFLDGGPASGAGVAALASFLERLNATTLLTYPGDLRERYDRRLEPLVQHCAAVLHLSAYGEGVGRMDVVKVRRRLWSESPAFFAIRAGRGVVPLDGQGARESMGNGARFRRQVLLFQGVDGLPEEFLSRLEGGYAVSVHASAALEVPEVLPPDVGAVLLAARWDAIDEATAFLRRLRRLGNRTPVVLVTRGDVRSADRARALLAGFDEVILDSFGPEEFLARVAAVVRRGRSATVPLEMADVEVPFPTAFDGAAAAVVDEDGFRATLAAARDGGEAAVFSVLFLSPADGELGALVNLVARIMRAASGDVAAVIGDRVAVYLPGTRRTDVAPFLRRVSDAWRRSGAGELRVAQFAFPEDRDRLRADLSLPASSVHPPLAP